MQWVVTPKHASKHTKRECKLTMSPITTSQNASKNVCIHMVVTVVFGWAWWVFMSADGCSGTQLRVGAREIGKEGNECPLRTEITHDS